MSVTGLLSNNHIMFLQLFDCCIIGSPWLLLWWQFQIVMFLLKWLYWVQVLSRRSFCPLLVEVLWVTLHIVSYGLFKLFPLLPDIHSTNVEQMLGKSRTKIGQSVQLVSTRSNFFENKGNVILKSGKSLIQFIVIKSTSTRQAFDFFSTLNNAADLFKRIQHSLHKFVERKVGQTLKPFKWAFFGCS